jgi:hypothetical protein
VADTAHRQRRLSVSQTFAGMVAIDGLLDPEAGVTLLTALTPLASPHGPDDHRQRRADALTELCRRQRRADALTELCRRQLDTGHLHHWADGGPTTLDNLVLLCRTHHRTVHEGHWQLTRTPDGRWTARQASHADAASPRAA